MSSRITPWYIPVPWEPWRKQNDIEFWPHKNDELMLTKLKNKMLALWQTLSRKVKSKAQNGEHVHSMHFDKRFEFEVKNFSPD